MGLAGEQNYQVALAIRDATDVEAGEEVLVGEREVGVVAAEVLEEALREDRRELKPGVRIHLFPCPRT